MNVVRLATSGRKSTLACPSFVLLIKTNGDQEEPMASVRSGERGLRRRQGGYETLIFAPECTSDTLSPDLEINAL